MLIIKGGKISGVSSIQIIQTLYEQAEIEVAIEHRSIDGQVEYWAIAGCAALENPELPVSFVAEALAALAEPREQATAFVPC